MLLQVLDDGRLTDSKGRTVDFKNTVIIMTSNLASAEIAEYRDQTALQRKAVDAVLTATFRPEFLNRIDETVIFQPLGEDQIARIVENQMALVRARLERRGVRLELTKKAAAFLAAEGFDPAYGARPLKRVIQNRILDELSLLIIEGKVKDGDTVKADAKDGAIVMTVQ